MFSVLYGSYFSFQMLFQISSAICFDSEESKILSTSNGWNHKILDLAK